MEYYIRGKNKVNLSQNDFIAKGGEGHVFGKGTLIYKIYIDKSSIIPDGKVRELQTINHPNVIVPMDTVLDKNNARCGFTLKWIKDTIPLCKLFTNDFRNRNYINDDTITGLVDNIRSLVEYVHKKNCLIVDGNEFNYIVNNGDYKDVFCIDTDSMQTMSYPATAIMPSIKDPHSDNFSKFTDWYSFGIVAFQLFIGIHPYKGKHKSYKPNELERRMKDNISVFNKDVTVPKAARDFSHIPHNYFDWFRAIFEDGKRLSAPDKSGALTIIIYQASKDNDYSDIVITEIGEYTSEILYHSINHGQNIVKTAYDIHIDNSKYDIDIDEEIVFTPFKNIPIACKIENNRIVLRCLTGQRIVNTIDTLCTDRMIIDNTIYVKNEANLIELSTLGTGRNEVVVSIKNIWNVTPLSSIFYSNCIYQNVLGSSFIVIPVPGSSLKGSRCYYIKIKELDDYRIIDAKYDDHTCCLIGLNNGKYDKIIMRFDDSYTKYDCRIIEDITYREINFIVKGNGVVILINDENTIEIFRNRPFDNSINTIDNITLPLPLKLSKDGNTTLFFKNNKLNKMNLK